MATKTSIRFFNKTPIRACYDEKTSSWFYAATDLISILVETNNPRRYWNDVKRRNKQLYENCVQLKLTARDGKKYLTDVLNDTEINELLLLLPNKNNDNVKKWLKGLNNPLDEQSKLKAYELYDSGLLNEIEVGTTKGLQQIHSYIFAGLYDFAGKIRTKTITKDNFVFCDARYLNDTLKNVDKMPEKTIEEIVNKYIEMNIAHPFMEGNGRSTRIWLDLILKSNLKQCIDWSKIDKKDYLEAMRKSPLNEKPILNLIKSALTKNVDDRELFMKGIDYSYYYEEIE